MADGLTKALQGSRFRDFVYQIGLVDIPHLLKNREISEQTTDQIDEFIQKQADE